MLKNFTLSRFVLARGNVPGFYGLVLSTRRLVQKGYYMDKSKIKDVLETIANDMAEDARNFDGKPFTGKTVAEYLAYQGAAIAALTKIMKIMIDEIIK